MGPYLCAIQAWVRESGRDPAVSDSEYIEENFLWNSHGSLSGPRDFPDCNKQMALVVYCSAIGLSNLAAWSRDREGMFRSLNNSFILFELELSRHTHNSE